MANDLTPVRTVATLKVLQEAGFPTKESTELWAVGDCLTSFPAATVEDKLRLMQVLQARPDAIRDGIGQNVDIVHITIVRDCGAPSEEEPAQPYTRYIITDTEGRHYQGSGVYMVSDLSRLQLCVGNPPYDPPIPVTITHRKCKGTHVSFNLVPNVEEYLKRWKAHQSAEGRAPQKKGGSK